MHTINYIFVFQTPSDISSQMFILRNPVCLILFGMVDDQKQILQEIYKKHDEDWEHMLTLIEGRKNVTNAKSFNSAQKFLDALMLEGNNGLLDGLGSI